MPQHDTASWVAYSIGVVGGSLIVGALLGLIPLVLGELVGQAKRGRVAFLVTVGAGFIGGVLLAVPSTLGFVVALLLRWRR